MPDTGQSTKARCSDAINNVHTIICQQAHTGSPILNSLVALSSSSSSRTTSLQDVHFQSNLGDILAVALYALGLDWSANGKELYRRAEPKDRLKWREPKASNTRAPKEERNTVLGRLEHLNLAHDADEAAATGGGRAAQRAAERARPEVPRVLELCRPDPYDRLQRGTGYGNVPRPLGKLFVSELICVDSLITWVHDHARACGSQLSRVDGGDLAYVSCHAMGITGVLRLQCRCGCAFTWSSAAPLPGPPKRPLREEAGGFGERAGGEGTSGTRDEAGGTQEGEGQMGDAQVSGNEQGGDTASADGQSPSPLTPVPSPLANSPLTPTTLPSPTRPVPAGHLTQALYRYPHPILSRPIPSPHPMLPSAGCPAPVRPVPPLPTHIHPIPGARV